MVAGVRPSLNSSQADFCLNTDDQTNGDENNGKDRWPRGHLRELNLGPPCRSMQALSTGTSLYYPKV